MRCCDTDSRTSEKVIWKKALPCGESFFTLKTDCSETAPLLETEEGRGGRVIPCGARSTAQDGACGSGRGEADEVGRRRRRAPEARGGAGKKARDHKRRTPLVTEGQGERSLAEPSETIGEAFHSDRRSRSSASL